MTTARELRSLRPTRSTLLIGLLAAILGFALAVQVRSRQDAAVFPAARQEDLVRILDDLNSREDRLRLDIDQLERTREELTGAVGQDAAALTEARRRAEVLGILAGTLRAEGPGLHLTITDPAGSVTAEVLLDTIQELRDAGAEAIMLNEVRIVASSYVVRAGRGISVDGTPISAPYRFVVVDALRALRTPVYARPSQTG